MFWSSKKKKKSPKSSELPQNHPFHAMPQACQRVFIKSKLTEEEIIENFEIFLEIIIFASKINSESRKGVKLISEDLKKNCISYIQEKENLNQEIKEKKKDQIGVRGRSHSLSAKIQQPSAAIVKRTTLDKDDVVVKRKVSPTNEDAERNRVMMRSVKGRHNSTCSSENRPAKIEQRAGGSSKTNSSKQSSPNIKQDRRSPAPIKLENLSKTASGSNGSKNRSRPTSPKDKHQPSISKSVQEGRSTTSKTGSGSPALLKDAKLERIATNHHRKVTNLMEKSAPVPLESRTAIFPKRSLSQGKAVTHSLGSLEKHTLSKKNILPQALPTRGSDSALGKDSSITSDKSGMGPEEKIQTDDSKKIEDENPLSARQSPGSPKDNENNLEKKNNAHNNAPNNNTHNNNAHNNNTPNNNTIKQTNVTLQMDQFKSVNDYNIKKMVQIGKGAFSKVYLAKQVISKNEKKLCALKVIENYSKNPRTLQHFSNELNLLEFCKHPNVVEYITCFKLINKDEIWLVMEYCSCSLQELLAMYKMEERDMAFVSNQIIIAVAYLESKSVIHRDLKSANILLSTSAPYVKLADFGLALQVLTPRSEYGICGSRYWMAPEMLRNEGYGTKVDIWAIGCIIFEMMKNYPPYYEFDSVKAMYYTATKGAPLHKYPNHLSPELKDLLVSVFQLNPDDRITAAELTEHKWLQQLDSKDISLYSHKMLSLLQSVSFSRALDGNAFI